MIYIHFHRVTSHSLSHAPYVWTSRAQERIPQPRYTAKLSIIPGETAHVVFPFMPYGVVAMHEIAVIPETVPMALVNGPLIEIEIFRELSLNSGATLVGAVGQAPHAEGTTRMEIFRCADQRRIFCHQRSSLSHGSLAGESTLGKEREHRCAGYAIRRGHPFLHIFIAGVEVVGHVVVVAQVHGSAFGRP